MYGQNMTASERKAAMKSTTVMAKGQEFAPLPHAGENADNRGGADQRKDEAPWTVEEEASRHPGAIEERQDGRDDKDRNDGLGKNEYAVARPVAQQRIVGFEDDPAGAEQGVAEHQADAADDGKRRDPVERASGKLSVRDRNSAHHRADRGALDEGDHDRAAGSRDPTTGGNPSSAKLEGDAAKDQRKQEQQHRNVERARNTA